MEVTGSFEDDNENPSAINCGKFLEWLRKLTYEEGCCFMEVISN
jgi:hypothetical protein